MLQHGAESRRLMDELMTDRPPDPMQMKMFEPALDTVMGHEFCCEVVDLGPSCSNLKVGDIVVSLPVAFDAGGLHAVGYSNVYNGGYARADGAQRDWSASRSRRVSTPTSRQ